MWLQRTLLGLAIGLTACGMAAAQSYGTLRWQAGARPLGLQITTGDSTAMPGLAPSLDLLPRGSSVRLVGRAGLPYDLGVYGRVGTSFGRTSTIAGLGNEGGLTYGVGLSWDFSRSASAAFGWDIYDLRTPVGDSRDVRTSLGLQWRY